MGCFPFSCNFLVNLPGIFIGSNEKAFSLKLRALLSLSLIKGGPKY